MELTSRELATLVLFAVVVGWAFLASKDRRSLIGALGDVLKAFSAWKVWVPVVAYVTYSTGIVLLARATGLWTSDQWNDTVVVVVFTGLPILLNATKFRDGSAVVAKVIKDVVGVSALLVVYLNLAPLPLWGELLLQSVLGLLVMGSAIGKLDPKTIGVARFCDLLITLIGLALFGYVTFQVVTGLEDFDWDREGKAFALSVWLPLAQIPFVYSFGVLAATEIALLRLRLHNSNEKPPRRVRLAFIVGLRGSLRYASRFTMQWIPRVAQERSFRSSLRTMSDFRAAVRKRDRERRDRRNRLKNRAGVQGVDAQGLRLDRREFSETKKALDDMYFAQMGVRRNHGGRYSDDSSLLLNSWSLRGLPDDHGILVRTSGSGTAWGGWRRTIGGYYFGVGGRSNIEERWQYDGDAPPPELPAPNHAGWREVTHGDRSDEWAANDDEPGDN